MPYRVRSRRVLLQWGRAPMSAESLHDSFIDLDCDLWASMGPRSNERGKNGITYVPARTSPTSFNGAALQ